jgi:WD40 repeat protein
MLWDVVSGSEKSLRHFSYGEERPPLVNFAVSPTGSILASGFGSTVILWDLADQQPKQIATLAGHTGDVTCLAFSPDGKILASGSASRTRQFWAGPVQRLGGGRDNTVILWDVDCCLKEKCLEQDKWSSKRSATDGAWQLVSQDGTTAVSINPEGGIFVWDVAVGEPKKKSTLAMPWRKKLPLALALSPDGKALAVTDGDRSIFLWDLASVSRHLGPCRGTSAPC